MVNIHIKKIGLIMLAAFYFSPVLSSEQTMHELNLDKPIPYKLDDEYSLSTHWRVINDSVMGGVSAGKAIYQHQALLFSGYVSTENNGGFSSVYAKQTQLEDQVSAIKVSLEGDGNVYQIRLRTLVDGQEMTYKHDFSTEKGVVIIGDFKLDDFQASFRGQIIESAPKIKASNISDVGFLIVSKQSKKFSLRVLKIEFY